MCVVTTRPGEQGRFYRPATQADLDAVQAAEKELQSRIKKHKGELSLVPEEPLPPQGTLGFRVQLYGMLQWGDLFSSRQLLALTTLSRLTREITAKYEKDDVAFAEAVQTCLALAVGKQADLGNSLCRWEPVAQCPRQLFGRQAIPIVWDFAEGIPIGDSSGSYEVFIRNIDMALTGLGNNWREGQANQADATEQPHPDSSVHCVFTDPPYYDAIPYADLSDFFYSWMKRSLPSSYLNHWFSFFVTPKENECVVDEIKGHDKAYFENKMGLSLKESRRTLLHEGIAIVVFAHKSTAGWETQLQATIDAGWIITGSWPVDTECGSRLRAMNSAALASSIHLVCRPRVGDPIIRMPSGFLIERF